MSGSAKDRYRSTAMQPECHSHSEMGMRVA